MLEALPPECLQDPAADSPPETSGRKESVLNALANAAKRLARGIMRTLDCDPTLDLMPGGIAMAKGPIRGKNLFKGMDALRRSNKQVRDIVKELGLTKEQQQQLHRAISGENMAYQQIRELARSMFNK
jgi:hypothetical protein